MAGLVLLPDFVISGCGGYRAQPIDGVDERVGLTTPNLVEADAKRTLIASACGRR